MCRVFDPRGQGSERPASPAVGQGTVVAGFSSGELNAYRYENGRLVWQGHLARTSTHPPAAAAIVEERRLTARNG